MSGNSNQAQMFTIGEAASQADLPTKTVRYYADIDLVASGQRSPGGYRLYNEQQIDKLIFIRKARSFGFTVDECRELLGLFEDTHRSSRDVKSLALARLADIEKKMSELQALHTQLSELAGDCLGNDEPECPILASLAHRG